MTIGAAIATALTNDGALTALVGDRVYPRRRPSDEALPCVVYTRVSWPHEYVQDGVTMTTPRYQFSCYATTAEEADAVAAAVQLGRRGVVLERRLAGRAAQREGQREEQRGSQREPATDQHESSTPPGA